MTTAKVGQFRAIDVTISDNGGHYSSTTVEDALQELDDGTFNLNLSSLVVAGGFTLSTEGLDGVGIMLINGDTAVQLNQADQAVFIGGSSSTTISYPGTTVITMNS